MAPHSDEYFLSESLKEAQKAFAKGEVPVGVVIVENEKIIARAHNLKEQKKDALAHAEMLAIKKAQNKKKDWRLENCTLYSTLEPCILCASAILHTRIKRVVFSTKDLKWGGAGSKINLLTQKLFNHSCIVKEIEIKTHQELLKSFFKEIRQEKKTKDKTHT